MYLLFCVLFVFISMFYVLVILCFWVLWFCIFLLLLDIYGLDCLIYIVASSFICCGNVLFLYTVLFYPYLLHRILFLLLYISLHGLNSFPYIFCFLISFCLLLILEIFLNDHCKYLLSTFDLSSTYLRPTFDLPSTSFFCSYLLSQSVFFILVLSLSEY